MSRSVIAGAVGVLRQLRVLHVLPALLVAAAQAAEPVIELSSTVTGNQEQPKVLYLVPWQPPQGPEGLYQPLQGLVQEVFNPVDRDELRRELRYREQLPSAENTAP